MEYVRILRDLREDADKTQSQIAEVLGTSQTMYARYERGANELPIHHLITLSKYYGVSTDYLRLKSIELGYTLPEKWTRQCRIRIYFNAYNLLTFTKVKFVDPEHPDDELGRMYPLNKTFTFGLNFSF